MNYYCHQQDYKDQCKKTHDVILYYSVLFPSTYTPFIVPPPKD